MRLLIDQDVQTGERWIYSAGFNYHRGSAQTCRLDTELEDLRRLSAAGARVAVLSHQGSSRHGTARHLDHVAEQLSAKLGRPVRYLPENASDQAAKWSRELCDGEIAVFGNTRLHAGEETGSSELAARFAHLGDRVAVGGFSKAHRRHASNVGILEHLPGFAAESLIRETRRLAPWAGARADGLSAAVVGGVKHEKITGLAHLARIYDLVIPAGTVLNRLLRARGFDIGASALGEVRPGSEQAVRSVLGPGNRAAVHWPRRVRIQGPDGMLSTVDLVDGVPATSAIIDFDVEDWALRKIGQASRVLIAGTPGHAAHRNRHAGASIVRQRTGAKQGGTLLLGGDTAADLPWSGPTSTGGGSALEFLAGQTCAVFEALAANALMFADWRQPRC